MPLPICVSYLLEKFPYTPKFSSRSLRFHPVPLITRIRIKRSQTIGDGTGSRKDQAGVYLVSPLAEESSWEANVETQPARPLLQMCA